jgi:hypothetical protein
MDIVGRGGKARHLWACALLLVIAGCRLAGTPERSSAGRAAGAPEAEFTALEDRLLEARLVRLEFHVTSEGAFAADLQGELEVAARENLRLAAFGDFGGQTADLMLRSDGRQVEYGNGPNRNTVPAPPELREALLLGLTRMGILHNLARLTTVAPPDHADGGVREWVTVDTFALDALDPRAMSFEISVAGAPSGSASLEIDPQGRPVVRRQTVRFSSGEMRVVERYLAVTIEP